MLLLISLIFFAIFDTTLNGGFIMSYDKNQYDKKPGQPTNQGSQGNQGKNQNQNPKNPMQDKDKDRGNQSR